MALPPKGAPRDRWLTRAEAARTPLDLLAVPRKTDHAPWAPQRPNGRNQQAPSSPPGTIHPDWPLHRNARRCDCLILAVSRIGHSFVDLEQGIFYRLAIGRRATNKRQSPAPIPPRLLAHHEALGSSRHRDVSLRGMAGRSGQIGQDRRSNTRSAWPGYGARVTPHTLRHTAATWLMQRGVPIWQAAGYLGMSAEMIERTYGHHHPDYMRAAAQAITSKQPANISGRGGNVSLVVSLVEPENGPSKRRKT